jgi:ATP-dependent Clp protease adaptor protein ClpS
MSTKENVDIAVAEKVKIDEPSQYDVIVHNNDYTSYQEVILVLTQAFSMDETQALNVAHKVDAEGKGLCGTYSKEIADMKLVIVDMVKETLINFLPHRSREIRMLEFTVEKA